jgi:hypothetical protein
MVLTDTLGDRSPGVGYRVCDLECDVGVRFGDRAGDVEFSVVEEACCWILEDLSEGDNI